MSKKLMLIVAVLMVASLALAACTPTAAPAPKIKVCQVTDTGGIDDKSFNATAWKGVQQAVTEYGVEGKYLESQEVADYEKNLNLFIEEKCDLIVSVGFFLTDATKIAAEANPDMKFSIVDVSYDPVVPNILGQVFDTDGAAFLAGYVAAGMTKTGKVATFGGIQAASPNPGGYKGVGEALGIKTVNLAGCPPNPINFVGTVVNYLLLGKLPDLDELGRPLFAYGKTIHDQCPRRSHYEADEFVTAFGSREAAKGYCLYKMGCKGPTTYNSCSKIQWNEGTSFPIGSGHPCIGCTEQGIGFAKPIHALAELKSVQPPLGYPKIDEERGVGATIASAAAVAALAGAATAATYNLTRNLGKNVAIETDQPKAGERAES